MTICFARASIYCSNSFVYNGSRKVHYLSRAFLPTGSFTRKQVEETGQGHQNLLVAGYVRQSATGIFHILPLGLRVLDKIEARIDGLMQKLHADKLSLPTLGTKTLWDSTGRWNASGSELMKFIDRKGGAMCLSPTHEESITRLIAGEVNGWRQLPIRVYQVGRKFRDEMRPRGGMLRGREFLMKDLYTFDHGSEAAYATYEQVREVYREFFESLGVPYLVAEADSGNIGGDLSHEYHLPAQIGEDTLLKCDTCEYAANLELARTKWKKPEGRVDMDVRIFGHQTYPDSIVFRAEVPAGRATHPLRLLREAQKLDPSVTDLKPIGYNLTHAFGANKEVYHLDTSRVLKVVASDPCPKCEFGKLQEIQAVEIGHTFYLGTKYSRTMNVTYSDIDNKMVYPEMGCHGIGVTRLLATLAEIKSDDFGLQWPAGFAPYESVLVIEKGCDSLGAEIAERFGIEAIDDRTVKTTAFRVHDMNFKGVPRVYVLGKQFYEKNSDLIEKDQALADVAEEKIGDLVIEHVTQRGGFMRDWKSLKLRDLQSV